MILHHQQCFLNNICLLEWAGTDEWMDVKAGSRTFKYLVGESS
jgi:hypothetical protein